MNDVIAHTPIKHDGTDYQPGDRLEVSNSQAERLIALGAVEAIAHDPHPDNSDKDVSLPDDVQTDGASVDDAPEGDPADKGTEPPLDVPEPPPPVDPADLKPAGRKLFGKKGK